MSSLFKMRKDAESGLNTAFQFSALPNNNNWKTEMLIFYLEIEMLTMYQKMLPMLQVFVLQFKYAQNKYQGSTNIFEVPKKCQTL